MGREIKRVPLDFDWPLDKPWSGYINPHSVNCQTCNGSGATIAAQRLEDLVGLLMLSGSDALRRKSHPYFDDAPLHRTRGLVPSLDMYELTKGLAGRESDRSFGHDAIDRWSAFKKIVAAAGLPDTWGHCQDCGGEGIAKEHRAANEAWTPTEPPTGDGFQLWETVSEGSPISPVVATAEALAKHLSANPRWSTDRGISEETWLKFILGPGEAISFIMDAYGFRSGVEAAVNDRSPTAPS